MTEPLKVVITGASSGLGRALAEEYARRGATLGLIARRGELLRKLAASLPVRSHVYEADVRDAGALAECAGDFVGQAGCPDIVIANAGVSAGTDTASAADNAVFDEILSVNVVGMMLTFQAFLAPMHGRGRGTLAGVASVAGFRGMPGASAYCASKAAAISYLESLRIELRGSGLQVVTLCPGYIDTPMTAVNRYRMPFLITAEHAARAMVRAVDRGRRFHVLPWQMALAARLMRLLPPPLFDRAFARAPRKPRRQSPQ